MIKFLTRLKLRRIVRKLRKQRDLMKQELESRSENSSGRKDASARSPEYYTYMYSGEFEDGRWLP